MENTLVGQTIIRGGRAVSVLEIEGDAYVCRETGSTQTFQALRSQYDALFLAKKGKVHRKGFKGFNIKNRQRFS